MTRRSRSRPAAGWLVLAIPVLAVTVTALPVLAVAAERHHHPLSGMLARGLGDIGGLRIHVGLLDVDGRSGVRIDATLPGSRRTVIVASAGGPLLTIRPSTPDTSPTARAVVPGARLAEVLIAQADRRRQR